MKVEVCDKCNLPGMLIVRPDNAAENLMLRSFANHQGDIEIGSTHHSCGDMSLSISRRAAKNPESQSVSIEMPNTNCRKFCQFIDLKVGGKFRHRDAKSYEFFIKESDDVCTKVSSIIPGLDRCNEIVNSPEPTAIVEIIRNHENEEKEKHVIGNPYCRFADVKVGQRYQIAHAEVGQIHPSCDRGDIYARLSGFFVADVSRGGLFTKPDDETLVENLG